MKFHPTNHNVVVPCDIDSALGPIPFDFWPWTKVYFLTDLVSFPSQRTGSGQWFVIRFESHSVFWTHPSDPGLA